MAKRIIWLSNRRSELEFEVPLLRKMGYEVYTPKILPFEEDAAADNGSDSLLTIPPKYTEALNGTDFYGEQLSPETAEIMNKYFDIAFMAGIPAVIESVTDRFKGTAVLRAAGLKDGEGTYSDMILSSLGLGYLKKIEAMGTRFVFGEAVKGISKKECEFFRNHTLYMPAGMADTEIKDTWTGSEKKMLFICDGIKTTPRGEKMYSRFRDDFEGIPCTVAGRQPVEVRNDPKVAGNITEEEYKKLLSSHRCMYFAAADSSLTDLRPLEAVRSGIPLIFAGGGALDKLGGKDLPGRCTNAAQAGKKVKRLLSSNSYGEKIRRSQKALLEKVSENYCLPFWKEAMERIEKNRDAKIIPMFGRARKRLCIMLPEGFTGGVLDYTIRLIEAVKRGSEEAGDGVEIVFAHVIHDNFKGRDYFKPIKEMGIPVRPFRWKELPRSDAAEMLSITGIHSPLTEEEYFIADDGMSNFLDCDYMLLTSDRVPGATLFMQPYGVVAHDYIQRLVPEIFPEDYFESSAIQLVRNAKAVFTSTPVTLGHAVQYAGLSGKRLHIIPVPFSMEKSRLEGIKAPAAEEEKEDYFLWSTNITAHKNHKTALAALMMYYSSGGSFKCVVTGAFTEVFSPSFAYTEKKEEDSGGDKGGGEDGKKKKVKKEDYVKTVRDIIAGSSILKKNLVFMGNLPKAQYHRTLENARFMLHVGKADNGNGTAFDAAYFGVPTVTSDYAAMRFYDDYFSLNMKFFDMNDPEDMARVLLEAERDIEDFRKGAPSRESLEKLMIPCPDIYNGIYSCIKTFLAIN